MHTVLLNMDVGGLIRQVKQNCDISDAQSWGHFSICGLLMRLRELYLHEHGCMPWDKVPNEDVTQWIQKREQTWQELEGSGLRPLRLEGREFDPFDAEGINRHLKPGGLIYGSGIGMLHKPVFFIGRLVDDGDVLDYKVSTVGRELCRDLSSSPAMLQGRCISVRLDAIRSIVWEKFQNLRARKFPGALAEMFTPFGIRRDDPEDRELFGKIEVMLPAMARLFVMHETGEAFEDERTDAWLGMLRENNDKSVELYARAVKDLLADMSEHGPLRRIIRERDELLLKISVALLDGLRREIFPELMNAYQGFMKDRDWLLLEQMRCRGYEHARGLRELILELWGRQGNREEILVSIRNYIRRTV